MNRRQFTKGFAALGLAPALPVSIPAIAAPAAAAPASVHFLYPWAAHYAQVHNACTPAMLAKALKVPPETANTLFARLLSKGVLTSPTAGGMARAAKPFYPNMRLPGVVAKSGPTLNKIVEKAERGAIEHVKEEKAVQAAVPRPHNAPGQDPVQGTENSVDLPDGPVTST